MKPSAGIGVEPHPAPRGALPPASRSAMSFRPVVLLACILGLFAFFPPALRATTVVPPDFPGLVAKADAIYRGRVTAVESRHVDRPDGSRVIKTFVTIAIDRVLKGAAQSEITLEFLGGRVGADFLSIAGMPRFTVGAEDYVFVQNNGRQFCPLVAVMHGRYRVLREASQNREYVARDNRAPLTDLAEVGLPLAELPAQVRAATAAGATARALTPAAFEAGVVSEVQRVLPRARPN